MNKVSFRYRSMLKIVCCFFSIAMIACSKGEIQPVDRPVIIPPPLELSKEYFWGKDWQKTLSNYQISLQSSRLTDSAINKGIKVGVAIYSDWSIFSTLPFTIADPPWLSDTINLTYTAIPGKLTVFAKTAVEITWPSDVFIYYQP